MSQRMEQFPKPPQSLWKMIGPSFVFVALSLNGGEMLLWPDLVGRLGLQLLWVVPIILFFQYVVNMEIERYTIFTGKNVLQGLFERQSVLIPICIAGILISLVWPAWVSIAGNMTAFLVGLESKNFGGIMAFVVPSFAVVLPTCLCAYRKDFYYWCNTCSLVGFYNIFDVFRRKPDRSKYTTDLRSK
jgi:Mn2+/Fe2+ NRAMP family transporter